MKIVNILTGGWSTTIVAEASHHASIWQLLRSLLKTKPSPSKSRNYKRFQWVTWVGIAFMVSMTGAAWADVLAEDGTSNIALKILYALLPQNDQTSLTMAFNVLSTTLAWVAAGVIAYQIVHFFVTGARTGKMAYTSMGAMRLVVGLGFLMPSTHSGLSGAGLAVQQLAAWASGVADQVNNEWAETVLSGDLATPAGVPASIGGSTLASQVLRLEVCATATAKSTPPGEVSQASLPDPGGAPGANSQVWSYGKCGAVLMPTGGDVSGG